MEGRTKMKNFTTKATYVTEWDDGETVLESPCEVNLLSHEIISIGQRSIIQSPYTEENVDDFVESLDEEYIRFGNGEIADVIDKNEDFTYAEYDVAPFFRGNTKNKEIFEMKILDIVGTHKNKTALHIDNEETPYVIVTDFNGDIENPEFSNAIYMEDIFSFAAKILAIMKGEEMDPNTPGLVDVVQYYRVACTCEYIEENNDIDHDTAYDIAERARQQMNDSDVLGELETKCIFDAAGDIDLYL